MVLRSSRGFWLAALVGALGLSSCFMFEELGRAIAQGVLFFSAQFALGEAPWSPDGRSLIAGCPTAEGGLYRFSLDGGAPQRIRPEEAGYASWSPDGKWIAYGAGQTDPVLRCLSAEEPEAPRDLVPLVGVPAWSPDGAWLATSSEADTLVLVRVDGSGWKDLGPGVMPTWSPDGERLTCSVSEGERMFVELVDREGLQRTRLTRGFMPRWSPDGRTLLFGDWQEEAEDGERRTQVFRIEADGSGRMRLCEGLFPRWSPDGQRILVSRISTEDPFPYELVTVRADGSDERLLAKDGLCGRWSPDGSRVAFLRGAFFYELFVVNADGSDERSLGMVLSPEMDHALRGTEAETPSLEGRPEPALGR